MRSRIENILKKMGIPEEMPGFRILTSEIEELVYYKGAIGINEVAQRVAGISEIKTDTLAKRVRDALKCVDDEGAAFRRYVGFHPITNVTFVQNVAISILKEDKEWEM